MVKHRWSCRQNRRDFLITSASIIGGAGLAGCLGNQAESSPKTTSTKAKSSLQETSTKVTPTSQSNTIGTKDITIRSTEGFTIKGTLYGDGKCGIILVPQINMDRESWEKEATRLAKQGHLILAIDENPEECAASVLDAIRYLRQEQEVERVILIGASSGGEAVLDANAKATAGTIDVTITLSAAGGPQYAEQLQGRLLFVVSKGDEKQFVTVARTLHQNATNPKQLKLFSGDSHGQRLFNSSHANALRKQITQFTSSVCTK